MNWNNGKSTAQRLREIHAVALGGRETLVHMKMGDFNQLITQAAAELRASAGPGSQEGTALARRLRSLAEVGIVNARQDADTLRRAADWIEKADERIAIMEEGAEHVIRTGETIDLLAALDEGKQHSGLVEEE